MDWNSTCMGASVAWKFDSIGEFRFGLPEGEVCSVINQAGNCEHRNKED